MIGQSPELADVQADSARSEPEPGQPTTVPDAAPVRLDPTRYGDWERNGRCIDF
jgi:hypothetical protein